MSTFKLSYFWGSLQTDERYYKSIEKELDEFCDDYFANDTEVEKYNSDKNIPTDQE